MVSAKSFLDNLQNKVNPHSVIDLMKQKGIFSFLENGYTAVGNKVKVLELDDNLDRVEAYYSIDKSGNLNRVVTLNTGSKFVTVFVGEKEYSLHLTGDAFNYFVLDEEVFFIDAVIDNYIQKVYVADSKKKYSVAFTTQQLERAAFPSVKTGSVLHTAMQELKDVSAGYINYKGNELLIYVSKYAMCEVEVKHLGTDKIWNFEF